MKRRYINASTSPRSPARRRSAGFCFLRGLAISAVLAVAIACGESDEDRARDAIMAIYSNNVVNHANDALVNNGKQRSVPSEIVDACKVWKEAKYRPNWIEESEDDWDRWAREMYEWQEDNDKTDSARERLQDVWLGIYAATNVLQRDEGVIFGGEDFCKFKLKG